MGIEGQQNPERIRREQILFLSHPGSQGSPDFFSGYGLTTHNGRADRLVGLLMLDRPRAPYLYEHFLNLANPEQARCVSRLVKQRDLAFDFSAVNTHTPIPGVYPTLKTSARRSTPWCGAPLSATATFPPQRDFERAKAEFQRRFPV